MKPTIAEVSIPISFARDDVFDYRVPDDAVDRVRVGTRVLVSFRYTVKTGYVTKIKDHSRYTSRLKTLLKVLDDHPLIDASLGSLADHLQRYYFCSQAQAMATVLPFRLKATKMTNTHMTPWSVDAARLVLTNEEEGHLRSIDKSKTTLFVRDEEGQSRWPLYSALVKRCLADGRSALVLAPTHEKADETKRLFDDAGLAPLIVSSTGARTKGFDTWQKAKQSPFCFMVGTRSAILAPVSRLGLVIIDEEDHFAYHQEQVPYYRAAQIARFRLTRDQGQLVLGSTAFSMETQTQNKDATQCITLPRLTPSPEIKIIDLQDEPQAYRRRRGVLAKTIEYRLADALDKKEKVFVYVPQKGFSTFLYCRKCRRAVACPHCSVSLRFSFQTKKMSCPLCTYKAPMQEICPTCQSSYVRYAGCGIEKVDNELARLFPRARIVLCEKGPIDPEAYDIMLSTTPPGEQDADRSVFDRTIIIGVDTLLGHLDFRSTEKAYQKLLRCESRTRREICLQTLLSDHYAMTFFKAHDTDGFLRAEGDQRREMRLPPAVRMAAILVRAQNETKAKQGADKIYRTIRKKTSLPQSDILKPVPVVPFKVRGHYRYHILMRYNELEPFRDILWKIIQNSASGATISLDPSIG